MQESKQNKIVLLQQMIENAERSISAAKQIVRELNVEGKSSRRDVVASQVVEGTFDGEKMVSMDGKNYPVPANYASKSKLVEGDILKLTITDDGSFVYKKISSVDTRKIVGTLMKDNSGKYYVSAEGRKYSILLASLTYFKAEEGDEIILVVPKEKVSTWAAVESIMKDGQSAEYFVQDSRNGDSIEPDFFDDKGEFSTNKSSQLKEEDDTRNAAIEDEWMPDIDEIKKEGSSDTGHNDQISDDFSN